MRSNFDVKQETNKIIQWIKEYFYVNGGNGAVIGISGGKDSTIVAKLLVEAIGKDRVFGVMMPNGKQKDLHDSMKVCEILEIKNTSVNIESAFEAITTAVGSGLSEQALVNVPPRLRMTVLYAIAQTRGYRVCGTSNSSEAYVGYCTKHGDMACDFNPILNYDTEEVIAIGDYIYGIEYNTNMNSLRVEVNKPEIYRLIHKTPSDGLCGKTDEDNLGVTYEDINKVINTGTCENKFALKIIEDKHKASRHKFEAVPSTPAKTIYKTEVGKIDSSIITGRPKPHPYMPYTSC
ncbi:MAG: NAD(+) synthase [Clostridium butyricum]